MLYFRKVFTPIARSNRVGRFNFFKSYEGRKFSRLEYNFRPEIDHLSLMIRG